MELLNIESILELLTLSGLEIILGIDNVIFIALLVQPLEKKQRFRARVFGLSLALIARVLMLFGATWIMQLTKPLFTVFNFNFSGRSLLLIIGGLFLVIKSLLELKEMFCTDDHAKTQEKHATKDLRFVKIISEIIFIDIVLSFDSIITAVGITNNFPIMVTAIVIAMIVMLISSNVIGEFIYKNPSIKVLALAFIGFLGVILVLAGVDIEVNKAYLYFSMFFAGIVETINIHLRKKIQYEVKDY